MKGRLPVRISLAVLLPLLLASGTALPAYAQDATPPAAAAQDKTAQEARDYADNLGKQVLTIVQSGTPEAQKLSQLQQMFVTHVDIPWVGRFVLGRFWRQATEEQRARYLDAYAKFVTEHYTSHFTDYAGGGYTITGAREEGEGQFTVNMRLEPAGKQPILVNYRLRTESGQFKVFDIIIEGVSLITTQRSEFASVVQNQGLESLITQLSNRTLPTQAGQSQAAR